MRLNNTLSQDADVTKQEQARYLAMAQEAEARAEESKTSQAREVWLYVARSYRELADNSDK